MVDEELSRAMVTFVGTPGVLDPAAPEEGIGAVWGDRALDLVPRIHAVLSDLESVSPPLWQTSDLDAMAGNVERWLHMHHSELSDEAVGALIRAYTFDWK